MHDQESGRAAQAEASGVESQQGKFPRLAGIEHDERGTNRLQSFNEGTKETGREIDFVKLRQGLAKGTPWTEELIESLMPAVKK